jgi:glycosyltransferase involved in cell wall biosynthesis
MKILYACKVELDRPTGATEHVLACARELARHHALTLLAPTSHIPGNLPYRTRGVRDLAKPGVGHAVYNITLARTISAEAGDHDVLYTRAHPGIFTPGLVARRKGLPHVVEFNGIVPDELERLGASRSQIRVVEWAEAVLVRRADHLVAVADQIADHLVAAYRVPRAAVSVVPNGFDPERFSPRPKIDARATMGLDPWGTYVGFIGGLMPWQGLEDLVQAAKHIDAMVLIAGDGPEREHLEALAPSNVMFLGAVETDKAPDFMCACDVLVLTKRPKAGSTIKLFAYLACERPVVATDMPELDIVKESGAGELVPPGDPEALARAVARLLSSPTDRGKRDREIVLREHTWERTAARTAECMEAVITRQRTAR